MYDKLGFLNGQAWARSNPWYAHQNPMAGFGMNPAAPYPSHMPTPEPHREPPTKKGKAKIKCNLLVVF